MSYITHWVKLLFDRSLYFCISVIDKKKHLCVIDNIETFVKHDPAHPIQEGELEKIVEGCYYAARKARESLIPAQKESDYRTFYGFLLVTRDTTVSTALYYLEDHRHDFRGENEIDISDWFCTEEIYKNKKAFCAKKGKSFESDCYEKAYENILGDISAYRWGLNGIVSKMYKHSHRRNVECIPDALAAPPEREIQYFNEQWAIAQGVRSGLESLKSLCRKYIFRVLIDHVQRNGYFDKLMVEDLTLDEDARVLKNMDTIINCKPQCHESNSFARKISTILHRYALSHRSNQYVSFPRLIHSIFIRPNLPNMPTDEQINKLGKILFLMNDTRKQETNWTSSVCIKFNSEEKYNEPNLCTILRKQWGMYLRKPDEIDDISEFGVRITEAGSFFTKILPDFEYFSCRYLSREPALFSKENIKSFIIGKNRIYRAIAIIRVVRAKAFVCIDDVIEKDYEFFASHEQENGMPFDFSPMFNREYSWLYKEAKTDSQYVHPRRILGQHIGYISNYIDYVSKFIPDEEFETPEDRERLVILAKAELKEYDKKLLCLQKKHPGYFKPQK